MKRINKVSKMVLVAEETISKNIIDSLLINYISCENGYIQQQFIGFIEKYFSYSIYIYEISLKPEEMDIIQDWIYESNKNICSK